jgi:hypothetical protein
MEGVDVSRKLVEFPVEPEKIRMVRAVGEVCGRSAFGETSP